MQSTVQAYSSVRIGTKSGPLAQIWLAANMSNLPKTSVLQTSIQESADEIAKASGCSTDVSGEASSFEYITLHTSGDLLQGIVRVYSKQAAFLLTDIKDTLMKISTIFKANQRINVTVGKSNTIASIEQLILQDSVTEREVLSVPSLDFLENDQTPPNLLDGDNSMRRRVQGAAPWDTSLEIGRGFGGDDDLDLHETSALNLDFDFEDGQSSKTWEEGTRQTTLDEGSMAQSRAEMVPLIEDDDFPLDDPNNGQWDLGISKSEQEGHDEDSSTMSVELGRRAGNASMVDDNEDLGIDLGLEKEPLIEEPVADEEPMVEKEILVRLKKNSGLANAKAIDLDNETELKEPQIRQTFDNLTDEGSEQNDSSLTKRRLLDELRLSINYLPSAMLTDVLSFQKCKRQKLNSPEVEVRSEEAQIDISLSLDEHLISNDDTNDGSACDTEDSDHIMPIAADIGQPPADENLLSSPERESSQTQQDSSEQPQEVRLPSSDTASKTTVRMAELLRAQFLDIDAPTFDDLLSAGHKSDVSKAREDISKKEASRAFFDLLSLANEDCIDLDQESSFDSIAIRAKPNLFTKFITA
ncbi:hypothetical protein HG536_0G03150 [Torulaspora globosa]|uniref:Rad21/Rec8-like protein N-terminal domain-containing protein n=1 Tax=Torulaspora globosa TaxID=48254 RepID=A0A7G3ZLR7_9SACH|nr:uncharacterized protein HG536_0G03150 [Torulaspora globosa]QLL34453.1 hypothetical protein HG536_0G03150 [Torulaspora globosa]